MPGEKRYKITYTRSAVIDIGDKADYLIYQYCDSELAEIWYRRLTNFLRDNLTSFPYKYPVYNGTQYDRHVIRYLTYRNDIVFYCVDELMSVVFILAVCTRGQDTDKHLRLLFNI